MKVVRRGFTLIEVLIVVVIVAVLAAVVLPRFGNQRGRAETAEAISVASAIHGALLQYEDANEAFPAALDGRDEIVAELGISYTDANFGWTFETDDAGLVTATHTDSLGPITGTMTLNAAGVWSGTGDYDPATGKYWPTLN